MTILRSNSVLSASKEQSGFTLIEVLVAIVIAAVGLLGLSAMQITSLKVNQGAYHRSQASIIASDILDRMRVNPAGVAAGNYDGIDTGAVGDDSGIPSAQTCITATTGCTAANIALQDSREWAMNFKDVNGTGSNYVPLITNGRGTVSRALGVVTVTISWDQESWSSDGKKSLVAQNLVVQANL